MWDFRLVHPIGIGGRDKRLPRVQIAAMLESDTCCADCGKPGVEQHAGFPCCGDADCRAGLAVVRESREIATALKRRGVQ
jgi:hypothetical protein